MTKNTSSLTKNSTTTNVKENTSAAVIAANSSSSRSIGALALFCKYCITRQIHTGPPTATSSTINMVCQEYQNAPFSSWGLVYVTEKTAGRFGALAPLRMAAYLQRAVEMGCSSHPQH
eukprot:GHUV01032068.1.p2 GENE.GHUV01032068.1~~GHUV01032068.1.p2  ORF type:complete len:118 (+),score=21.23 GHUV01032068.1:468-821(+)